MEKIVLENVLRHTENREVVDDSQHGFTKGKLCLIYLLVFHDGVSVFVDTGRANVIIYLDTCKAFHTV